MVQPMRLSRPIYTLSSSLWRVHALRSPRYVTWYQSHGLGLGLDSSNSPTIRFFSLGSFRGPSSRLLCFGRPVVAPPASSVLCGSSSHLRTPSSSPRESRADPAHARTSAVFSVRVASSRADAEPVARPSSRRRDARITWP